MLDHGFRSRALSGALLVLALGAASGGLAAGTPRIVNGLLTHDFPTTGALLVGFGGAPVGPDTATIECSGTLIGCRTFLTAAHCVAGDADPTHYAVYLQHAGVIPAASVTANPAYTGLSGSDVAIVKLASDVTGVTPTAINATHDLVSIGVGLPGTIVGFGQTSATGRDYGIKRAGAVVTASCLPAVTGGEGNDKLVCWDFALPVGPPGQDSDTCNGDSGGPLFLDFGAGPEVAGVTSSGSSPLCRPLDHSFDASVYFNAAWIAGQLAGDSIASCGPLAPVGAATTGVAGFDGTLTAAHPSDLLAIDVPAGTARLRVALNGQDNHLFGVDLFVKQGASASPQSYDCKADGASDYGFCEFADPAPGPWSAFVLDAGGAGAYQLTATTFAVPAQVCGDGLREGTEQCDGADLGACNAAGCNPDCTCVAACGDGVVEPGELCDDGAANGTSASCCSAACTLAPDGAACADDGNPCTRDACNGTSAVCQHPPGNPGATCRGAVGACDVAETCDGVSAACPPDAVLPDTDGDGSCDAIDPCTNVGGGQDFLDASKPRLALAKVGSDPVPGNDTLTLAASFQLAAGEGFAAVDPLAHGGHWRVTSASGQAVVVDVSLPPGAFAGRGTRGWSANRSHTRWTFVDATAAPAGGIGRVSIADESKKGPRRMRVAVRGRDGSYALAAGDLPLHAIVVLGDQADATAGLCGESAFVAGDCRLDRKGDALTCAR